MVVVLLASRADPASVNLRDRALRARAWREVDARVDGLPVKRFGRLALVETPRLHLACDLLDREMRAEIGEEIEAILVLSKHKAASGSPALTVHPIGNYRDAEFGGRPGALVPSAPALATRILVALARDAKAQRVSHAVTWEATHHGPYFETPTTFVEIGTTEASWNDPALGALVAKSLIESAEEGPVLAAPDEPVLIALGGSHYAPRATDLAKKRRCAIGHVIPSYQIEAGLTDERVAEAARKTPHASGFFLDDRSGKVDFSAAIRALEGAGLKRVDPEALAVR